MTTKKTQVNCDSLGDSTRLFEKSFKSFCDGPKGPISSFDSHYNSLTYRALLEDGNTKKEVEKKLLDFWHTTLMKYCGTASQEVSLEWRTVPAIHWDGKIACSIHSRFAISDGRHLVHQDEGVGFFTPKKRGKQL